MAWKHIAGGAARLLSITVLVAAMTAQPLPAQSSPDAGPAATAHDPAQPADTACVAGLLESVDLTTVERDVARALELAGALALPPAMLRRPGSMRRSIVCSRHAAGMEWALRPAPAAAGGPRIQRLPVSLDMESNSQFRRSRNNGPLRGGVGPSLAAGAGIHAEWGYLSITLDPRLIRDSNRDFETFPASGVGRSEWGHPHHATIDLPQRFGDEDAVRLDPGQSQIRLGNRRAEIGLSTENAWLGPAQVYPILLSSTAGGFPHVFAGTATPVDIGIGQLSAQILVGRLAESDFFDQDPDNDRRILYLSTVQFSPGILPGLHLGLARVLHEGITPEGVSFTHALRTAIDPRFTGAGGGNREGNGLGSLFARWVFPSAGFEAYAEWSREDTPWDLQDLIDEPDWTQAWTLGFQQLVQLRHARLRWYGELVHLGESTPVRGGRGFFSYYTHNAVIQGHTHEGQLLGAAAGPGSDAQILGVDTFHGRGMTGLWVERVRTDEDTYYRRYARMYGESRHDVEIGLGLRHAMRLGAFRISGEALLSRRANRSFLNMDDPAAPRLVERNTWLRVRAAW